MPVTMVAHLRAENERLRRRVRELEAAQAIDEEPAYALFRRMAERPRLSLREMARTALFRLLGSKPPPAQKRA